MAEIVNITSINPFTFEAQSYSSQDEALITSIDVNASFNPTTDIVEYFVYDLNGDIIFQNNFGFPGYSLIDNNLVLDPEADLRSIGFDEGQYNTLYNFVSPKMASSALDRYFISQISPDRTEVRLDTTDIPNDVVITSSLDFINTINTSTGSYYDFYLNFDNNQSLIAVNALLDTSSIDNPTVLIKLYEALPQEFDINSQCWVITQVAEPVAYNINIIQTFDLEEENIPLRGPNTNISLQDQISNSTSYSNLNQLNTTNQSQGPGSLQYQLNSMLAQTGVEINVDYSDYNNFIHFSSAQTRLENFYYKLSLIETYQISASLSSGTTTNYYVSSSNLIWQAKINELITGFDDYEYYLYYTSGSTSWPKSNSTPPYTNVLTTSVTGQDWFISQSIVAEEYDIENNNALINSIPSYLREDPENAQYELFIEMVGQYFDTIFLYTQDITNKYNVDNRVNYGVSKDLVADILRDMGIKIYQNNFSTNDLYSALLGFTPSGSLYNLPYTTGSLPTPTGYEYINTYITASATGSLVPTEDINAEIYKRIYSNLPYLLKKKGTTAGLKALVTLYGIPDTILQVNEFGGQNEINFNDYDLWFDQYNYAFDTQGTNYVSSSFILETDWNSIDNVPRAVEFRFQTRGLPTNTGYYSQSLWSTDTGVELRIRYTGSGFTSGSYSGSIVDPYNKFALIDFIPDITSPTTSASVYLPIFDGGWWSVLVNRTATDFTLYAGNKTYLGSDANYVAYLESASITGDDTSWIAGQLAYLGSGSLGKIFSGSLQEYRFYTETLNSSSFEDYIMYPYSIDADGINTAPDVLAFRAALGGELYTASLSIHPKITGSWTTLDSFQGNDSTFAFSQDTTFVDNTEMVFPNQFPAGIKNRVSNKIRQQNEVLPYSGSKETNLPQNTALSPFISVQQDVPESGSYTPNIDYVEVAFSPQNEINNDIAGQLGYFNIGEYIGDPRQVSSSAESYPELDALRNYYFEKYTSNYNIWDYIRLIKYFDNSLFKMIQDWVPARTSLASGIVIKQTTLERNKYPVPQLDLSSSLAMVGSNATSSVILFQGNDEAPICIPITSSGVYNLYVTGSISNSGGDDPTLFDVYITSSNGIFSLFSQDIDDGSTVPFSGSYNANIPSGSSLCFIPDSLVNAYYLNNVTASLLVANTSTYPYTTQDMLITGSPIQMYEISASTGGTTPDLIPDYTFRAVTASNGQTYLTEYGTPLNPMLNLTQSWLGSTPSLSGSVPFTQSTAIEFFNGELSGSILEVENGELNEDNPYKMASTQLLNYNTTASTNTTPIAGRLNWVSSIGYNPSTDTFFLFVVRIHINEVDTTGFNIQTALGNLQAGDEITFTINGKILPPDSSFTANTLTGVISSVVPTSATTWTINFANQPVYFANYNPGDTLDAYLVSSNVFLSPFLNDSSEFNNSAFNPIINNVILNRPNPDFYDVDFSSNSIVAVNRNVIISASRGSGSATPSTTPASNYTTARIANPRYFGCKNTSLDFNVPLGNSEPSVEKDETFFAYFDWVGGTNYEVLNKAGFHIKYLIDSNGNALTPNLTSSYYYNLTRTFNEQSPVNVIFQADQTSGNVTPLQGVRPVIKSGALAQAVIFSQFSSSVSAFTLATMSFSTATLNTNYTLQTEIDPFDYTSYGTFETLNLVQPATSGSNATTASISGDFVALVESDPEPQIVPKLYLEVLYNEYNYSYPANADIIIQKSTNNGATWSNYTQYSQFMVAGDFYQIAVTAPPDTATSGSRYRAQIYYDLQGGFPYAADPHFDVQYGVFYLTSNPPFNAIIPSGSGYWTTGSNSANVLTGSLFTSDIYGVARQTTITASGGYSAGYDAPYQVFTVQTSDEIRFGASENQVYQIIGVNSPTQNISNSLYLTLDKPIVTGTNINSFLLRRYIPNPNFVVVDALKTNEVGGGPGFLLPEYTSQQILDNFDSIVTNLTEKGLI